MSDLDYHVKVLVGQKPAGIDTAFSLDEEGRVAASDAYTVSAAWHMAWDSVELRVGIGASSLPGAWLLQSTELCWRFGGKTRMTEHRMRKTWKENEVDVDEEIPGLDSYYP